VASDWVSSRRPDASIVMLDEQLGGDALAVGRELERRDPADRDAVEVDRRAHRERAGIGGGQLESPTAGPGRHAGRVLEPDEVIGLLVGAAGIDPDVGARHDRAEAGHAADADARALDPERGVAHREHAGVARQLEARDDVVAIVGQLDPIDLADRHVLEPDLRLAGLEAVGGLERHEHRRSGAQARPEAERACREHRDDRDDPDHGWATAVLADGGDGEVLVGRVGHRGPSQIERGSNAAEASIVRTTTPANGITAGPGSTRANAPSWTIEVSSTTTNTSSIDQ
jgi:hypothetical protein